MSIVFYAVLGILAGALAGLLGLGGGTVIVPGLAVLYAQNAFPTNILMHMAVGTSLATMIATSSAALFSHLKRHQLDWSIFSLLLPGLLIGTMLGVLFAERLPTEFLRLLFGCYLVMVSFQMAFSYRVAEVDDDARLPAPLFLRALGLLMGFICGMLGIGGGTLAIPYFLSCRVPMQTTVLLATAVTLSIACVGTSTAIFTGIAQPGLPMYSWGYVYLPAVLMLSCFSMGAASVFAPLSHRIPSVWLRGLSAVFILFVGIHMIANVKL